MHFEAISVLSKNVCTDVEEKVSGLSVLRHWDINLTCGKGLSLLMLICLFSQGGGSAAKQEAGSVWQGAGPSATQPQAGGFLHAEEKTLYAGQWRIM